MPCPSHARLSSTSDTGQSHTFASQHEVYCDRSAQQGRRGVLHGPAYTDAVSSRRPARRSQCPSTCHTRERRRPDVGSSDVSSECVYTQRDLPTSMCRTRRSFLAMQALQRLAQLLARSPPAVLLQPQPLAFLALRDTALPVIKEHQRRLRCSPWCLHAAGPPSSDDETQRKAVSARMRSPTPEARKQGLRWHRRRSRLLAAPSPAARQPHVVSQPATRLPGTRPPHREAPHPTVPVRPVPARLQGSSPGCPCMQGMWAEREVPRMSVSMIRELEVVLDQENPDMFKWLTGQVRHKVHVPLTETDQHGGKMAGGQGGEAEVRGCPPSPADPLPARAAAQRGVRGAGGARAVADGQAPQSAAGSGAGAQGMGARLERQRQGAERRRARGREPPGRAQLSRDMWSCSDCFTSACFLLTSGVHSLRVVDCGTVHREDHGFAALVAARWGLVVRRGHSGASLRHA